MPQKAIVIGGGVVGALSAYYLARQGLAVTLIEKNADLGAEASAANANQLSYSHIFPPVSPALLRHVPGILIGLDPALKVRALADPRFWGWALRAMPYLLSPTLYRRTSEHIKAIHEESRSLMTGFVARHGDISFSHVKAGRLMVYDSPADMARSHAGFVMHGLGSYVQSLSYEQALEQEPGLKDRKPFGGALFTPDDVTGDCEAFVRGLGKILQAMGVEIRTGQGVRTLVRRGDVIEAVTLANGEIIEGDIFTLTTGSWARTLLRGAGLRSVPIYPVKGYTYEIPGAAGQDIPFKASIVDTSLKMVFTPLEKSLKVSNGIIFEPHGRAHDERFLGHVQRAAASIYPAIDFSSAILRSGYRPWTPNSLPVVERRLGNLYLNIGHGMLGWTMAHGTAKRLANIIRRDTR